MYHDLNPIIIQLGPVAIGWYGLMYAVSFILGLYISVQRMRKHPWHGLTADHLNDLLVYIVLGVVLGGRLGSALFYNFDYYLANPLDIVKVWQGGMSFHGGFIGVCVAVILFARSRGLPLFTVGDYMASIAALGLFLGRIGNFINGELWGRAADVPWAMIFSQDPLQIARHPSQLYQAFGEGLLVLIIMWWFTSKPRPRMAASGLFMVLYGFARIVAEFFREPDAHIGFLTGFLTMGMLLSIPMILIGSGLLFAAYRKPQYPTDAARTLANQPS